MDAYIPATAWLISAGIFVLIASKRKVRVGLFWSLVVVFLGPFAIPLIFFANPDEALD